MIWLVCRGLRTHWLSQADVVTWLHLVITLSFLADLIAFVVTLLICGWMRAHWLGQADVVPLVITLCPNHLNMRVHLNFLADFIATFLPFIPWAA